MNVLLRVGRRITRWSATTAEEFCRLEFWSRHADAPDQALSVYMAPPGLALRVCAEHAAAAGLDPPGAMSTLDVSDGVRAARDQLAPRNGPFFFTNLMHYELHFAAPGDVFNYAAKVFQDLAARRTDIPKGDVVQYARARVAEGDAEWVRFVATAPKGSRWR